MEIFEKLIWSYIDIDDHSRYVGVPTTSWRCSSSNKWVMNVRCPLQNGVELFYKEKRRIWLQKLDESAWLVENNRITYTFLINGEWRRHRHRFFHFRVPAGNKRHGLLETPPFCSMVFSAVNHQFTRISQPAPCLSTGIKADPIVTCQCLHVSLSRE